MPEQSVIVWDLETVPDLAGFGAANDLVGPLDKGVNLPRHAFARIVSAALAALIVGR
jgi:hypothetical protein